MRFIILALLAFIGMSLFLTYREIREATRYLDDMQQRNPVKREYAKI